MSELNPIVRYTFKSRKGGKNGEVTIHSRLGEASARQAAMIHFWGPLPDPVVPTREGKGLELLTAEEVT